MTNFNTLWLKVQPIIKKILHNAGLKDTDDYKQELAILFFTKLLPFEQSNPDTFTGLCLISFRNKIYNILRDEITEHTKWLRFRQHEQDNHVKIVDAKLDIPIIIKQIGFTEQEEQVYTDIEAYNEDFDVIAAKLGISIQAVYSSYHQAKQKLDKWINTGRKQNYIASTGIKGIYLRKNGKYQVQIKRKCIGTYLTLEEAKDALENYVKESK